MQKFLSGVPAFTTASGLLAIVYLTSAVLGGAMGGIADTLFGLFLLALVVVSVAKLAYELWNRLRFEYALRTAIKTKATTVTAMKPYTKPWPLAPYIAVSILICTVLYIFNPPVRFITVLLGAIAGTFVAVTLIVVSVAYVFLWCWRKFSKQDRRIKDFNLIFPWWSGEEAELCEMSSGWPKDFSFRAKHQLPHWWSGL